MSEALIYVMPGLACEPPTPQANRRAAAYWKAREDAARYAVDTVPAGLTGNELMAYAHGLEDAATILKGQANRREEEEIRCMMAL